jgi:hypothetical protein
LAPFTMVGPIMLFRYYYLGIQKNAYWGPILTLILGVISFPIIVAKMSFFASFFCLSSIIASVCLLEKVYSEDFTRENRKGHILRIVFVCILYLIVLSALYAIVHLYM